MNEGMITRAGAGGVSGSKLERVNPNAAPRVKGGFWTDLSTLAELHERGIRYAGAQVFFLVRELTNNRAMTCTATDSWIASRLCMGLASVGRAITALAAAGVLERVQVTGGQGRKRRGLRLGAALNLMGTTPSTSGSESIKMREPSDIPPSECNEEGVGCGGCGAKAPSASETVLAQSLASSGLIPQVEGDPEARQEGVLDAVVRAWAGQALQLLPKRFERGSFRLGEVAVPAPGFRSDVGDLAVVLERACSAYGKDPVGAFRQLLRAAASTPALRERLHLHAYRYSGLRHLEVGAVARGGGVKHRPVLRDAPGQYPRLPPEPVAEALAQVSDAEVGEVMQRHLDPAKWGDPCWRPCVRELAARAKAYGMSLEEYLQCADAVQKLYPETPYLWIADSVTGAEIEAHLAGPRKAGV